MDHKKTAIMSPTLHSRNDGRVSLSHTRAVFFDLTKAFDSVPHRQLVSKLRAIGLNEYLVFWITNYLTNTTRTKW